MNFIEAVEQIKQGKKIFRPMMGSDWYWVKSNHQDYSFDCCNSETGYREAMVPDIEDYVANDWELVEEPKPTLFNKVSMYEGAGEGRTFEYSDVKEALKEYFDWFNDFAEHGTLEHYKKAKEIFGVELLQ